MNLTSLDKVLKTMSPHEVEYKNGSSFYSFNNLPVTYTNGQPVLIMNFPTTSVPSTVHELIFIKKQSRYQACPTHIHNWIEINYMYSGNCSQIINQTSHTLKKGQVVLIDTDTPHSTGILGDNDIMVNILIDKQYLNTNFFNRFSQDSILSEFFINSINMNTTHNNYILFHSENSPKLSLFFNELLCEMYDPSINSTDIINSLMTLVLCELINVYKEDIDHQTSNISQSLIAPILRYIEANYQTCTLESTATFFNMNPHYMTTLLKQRTGDSYKELIQRQRFTRAAWLLRNTSVSITNIANNVGYENMSFFYKKFKQKYGCSPNEYRSQMSKT